MLMTISYSLNVVADYPFSNLPQMTGSKYQSLTVIILTLTATRLSNSNSAIRYRQMTYVHFIPVLAPF